MHPVRKGTGTSATPGLEDHQVKNRETTGEAGPTASQRPLDQEPIHYLRAKTGGSRYQTLRRVMNQYVAPRPNFAVPKPVSSSVSKISKPMPLGRPRRREEEARRREEQTAEKRGNPYMLPRQKDPDVELNIWKQLRNKLNPLRHLSSKRILNQNGKSDMTPFDIEEKLRDINQKALSLEAGVKAPRMTQMQFWIETLLQAESGLDAIIQIEDQLRSYLKDIKANGNALEQLTVSQVNSTSTGPLRRMTNALETLFLINEGKYTPQYGDTPGQLVFLSKFAEEIRNSVIQPKSDNGPEQLAFKDLGNDQTYVFSDSIGKHFVASPTASQTHEIQVALNKVRSLHRQVQKARQELQNHGVQAQAGTSVDAGESRGARRIDKGKAKATT